MNHHPSTSRGGFTLIELLVSIGILLILATITFTMVGAAMKGDSIRSGARQIQSYVEGARDRALHAKADRGVRFLPDPNNPAVVHAMVFIQAQDPETAGQIQIKVSPNTTGPTSQYRKLQVPAGWTELQEKGLLGNQIGRIEIYSNSTTKAAYSMVYQDDGSGTYYWFLTKNYNGTIPDTMTGDDWGDGMNYILYLGPAVMPNQEPRLLPSGVVIDLPHSRVPWGAGTEMDVLFSPRGTITGLLSSYGNIHFLLADTRDVDRGMGFFDVDTNGNSTIDPDEKHKGDNLVVTITTQTGKVTSHPVSYTGSTTTTTTDDDPFEYAETGAEAK